MEGGGWQVDLGMLSQGVEEQAWLCRQTNLGVCPGEGNGYPVQYSCLENSMDREAWWATVHGITKSDTTEYLTLTHRSLWTAF